MGGIAEHLARGMFGVGPGLSLHLSSGIFEDGLVAATADLPALQEQFADYIARAIAASAAMRAGIEAGEITSEAYGQFDSEVRALNTIEKAIRAVLDDFRAASNLLFDSPTTLIDLWKWEKTARRDLLRTGRELRDTAAAAREVVKGDVLTIHTVTDGDSLQRLALIYYSDHRAWRTISAANGLVPGALTIGAQLIIPTRE